MSKSIPVMMNSGADSDSDAGFVPSTLSSAYRTPLSQTHAGPLPSAHGQQQQEHHLDTLDEPVSVTIKRDLKQIWTKLLQVLVPTGSRVPAYFRPVSSATPTPGQALSPGTSANSVLADWDLWGPLLFCLLLASLLGLAKPNNADNLFASVFVLVWCGAGVVTVNGQLLGGRLQFFQSVCVLGYCLFPLVVGALLCLLIPVNSIKPVLLVVCYGWACKAATDFLTVEGFERRRLLAVYPILLFYFVIGWLVLVSTTSL